MESYSAIVAGSTGACGRSVVASLLSSSRCTKVTVLIRDAAKAQSKLSTTSSGEPVDVSSPKLVLKAVNWEDLCEAQADSESW